MFEYDSTFVFMSLDLAQVYFRKQGEVSAIELTVADPERIREVEVDVKAVIGSRGWIVDWRRANAQFVNALQVERNVMFVILTLIVLVAAFNIIAGLIMVVKDKGRDIAILRTMGATRGANPAHILHERRGDRGGGHRIGRCGRRRLRREHRHHPGVARGLDRRRAVPGRDPVPLPAPIANRSRRGGDRGGHGGRAFLPGDDLPILAGSASRSGGGAPL